MPAGHMQGDDRRRTSFLLRLWQAESHGPLIWRASLQNPDTGERRVFASVADLLCFLEERYSSVDGTKENPEVHSV